MSDLVEFLKARLDEDEQVALAASEPGGPVWPNSDSETRTPQMEHARRHDPARVLREIEATRQFIAEWNDADARLESLADGKGTSTHRERLATAIGGRNAMNRVVRVLAQLYDWHDDYREEWRPA